MELPSEQLQLPLTEPSLTPEPSAIKISPKSSPKQSPKSSPKHTPVSVQTLPAKFEAEEILQEIDDKFADTPPILIPQRASKKSVLSESEADPSVASRNVRNAKTFNIPVIKQEVDDVLLEQEVPLTPTRTRSHRKGRESSVEAEPMTPTRSSRRLKEKELNEPHTEVQTPTRSSRRGKKGDENIAVTPTRTRGKKMKQEIEMQEIQESPKHSTKRSKERVQESLEKLTHEMEAGIQEIQETPKHFTRRAKETNQESLELLTQEKDDHKKQVRATPKTKKSEGVKVELSAESSLPFSEKAKEVLQDTLQQVAEEMLDTVWEREQRSPDDTSPSRLTRIKTRERASMSPAPSPSRLAQTSALTPTRTSRRLAERENLRTQTESEESLAGTPPRGRKGRKTTDTAQSPALGRKVTDKLITPFRDRKNKVENYNSAEPVIEVSKSPSRNKTVVTSEKSPVKIQTESEENIKPENAKTAQTPTRGRQKKKEDKVNETGEVSLHEISALTPTRKSSRLKKETVDEVKLLSKHSLGAVDTNIDSDIMDTDSDKQIIRRHSFGRTDINVESFTSDVSDAKLGRRQSFTRSQTKKEDIFNADKFEGPTTRRHTIGTSGFKIESEKVEADSTRTPGRGKKSDHKLSPARDHQTDMVTPATTPSRRGRPRKKAISPVKENIEEEEKEMKAEKGTPSRKGRSQKTQEDKKVKEADLDAGLEASTVHDKSVVSRKGRGAKEKEDKHELEIKADEDVVEPNHKTTPSRSKRQKTERKDRGSVSPEKVVIAQSFAALVHGRIVFSKPWFCWTWICPACKQCRSRSAGFWRSQLIWIYTVWHEVFEFVSRTLMK